MDATASAILSVYDSLGQSLMDAARTGAPEGVDGQLAQHAGELDRLCEALNSPTCDFGVDYSMGLETDLPHLAKIRALARVLRADALRLLAAGDLDGAARRTAGILRLGVAVAQPARSSIELLIASACAQLGLQFVTEHPQLSGAAWKTDIQQAISSVGKGDTLNSSGILRREGELIASSLREGKMRSTGNPADRNWAVASQADRDAAAAKIEAINAESVRVWSGPDAVSKLKELVQRARDEGVGDLVAPLDRIREALEQVRTTSAAASMALRK